MPHTTIMKQAFGVLVKESIGSLSYMQASYKTGLSAEYLRMMAGGRVPSEAALARFAKGLNADLHALRLAAGYEQPDPMEQYNKIDAALTDKANGLTPEAVEKIRKVVKEVLGIVD